MTTAPLQSMRDWHASRRTLIDLAMQSVAVCFEQMPVKVAAVLGCMGLEVVRLVSAFLNSGSIRRRLPPWAVELTRISNRVARLEVQYSSVTIKRDLLGQCVREGAVGSARVVEDEVHKEGLERFPLPRCQLVTDVLHQVLHAPTRLIRCRLQIAFRDCSFVSTNDAVVKPRSRMQKPCKESL